MILTIDEIGILKFPTIIYCCLFLHLGLLIFA